MGGLVDLAHGPLLESQELRGAAGEPQTTGREGQAVARAGEQPVPKLATQLAHVQRHRRLGDTELHGGVADRSQADHGGKGAQLGGRHFPSRLRQPPARGLGGLGRTVAAVQASMGPPGLR